MITQRIKVRPGSFKDEILIDENNNWTVKIRAKPIEGEANKYLIKYLSRQFNINKSSVTIEKGTTNQYKTLNINIDSKGLERIINQYKK